MPDAVPLPLSRPLWPSRVSALLLVLIVAVTGLVMGGAREWIILPVYGLVVLLLLTQAIALFTFPAVRVRRIDPADLFAALFIVYAAIRYATAPVEYLARMEFFQIISCAAVFWTARYGLARATHGIFFLGGFILVAAGVALFSFWLRMHPELRPYGELVQAHYFPRLTGTFGNPNHYAAFLYMAVAALLGLFLFLKKNWWLRMVILYVVVMFILGIFFSLSRGGWIGLFFVLAAVVVFCARHAKIHWGWPVSGLAAILIAGVIAMTTLPEAQNRLEEVEYHLSHGTVDRYVRIQIARDALHIIADHFWFGTGPATFVHIHPRYHDASYTTLATYTHDDYLNLWCDYGVIGFVLGLGFVVFVSIGLARRVEARAAWPHRVLVCAGSAAWAGIVVHSFLDFSLHIPACAFALFTLAGLGLRRSARGEEAEALERRNWIGWSGAVGLLLGAVLFALAIGKTAKGYYPYESVERRIEVLPFDPAVVQLKRAVAADPHFWLAQARLGDYCRVEMVNEATASQTPSALRRQQELGLAAVDWYLRALRNNPLDDGIYERLSITYDLLGREMEGLLSLQKIIALQPHNGYFYCALGMHYWRFGQIPQAIAAFEQAMQCPYGQEDAVRALQVLRPSS